MGGSAGGGGGSPRGAGAGAGAGGGRLRKPRQRPACARAGWAGLAGTAAPRHAARPRARPAERWVGPAHGNAAEGELRVCPGACKGREGARGCAKGGVGMADVPEMSVSLCEGVCSRVWLCLSGFECV